MQHFVENPFVREFYHWYINSPRTVKTQTANSNYSNSNSNCTITVKVIVTMIMIIILIPGTSVSITNTGIKGGPVIRVHIKKKCKFSKVHIH